MPLYEYRCRACGHLMEVLQKLSDPPKRKCEKCAGRVDKVVSRTAFQLKGGGWYAEGYGKAGQADKAGKSEGSGSAEGAGTSGTSEGTSEKKGSEKQGSEKKGSEKKDKDNTRKAAAG